MCTISEVLHLTARWKIAQLAISAKKALTLVPRAAIFSLFFHLLPDMIQSYERKVHTPYNSECLIGHDLRTDKGRTS